MSVQERINVALSSCQMEHLVELARVRSSCHYISIKDEKSYIQLEISGSDRNFLYFDTRKDAVNITGNELWKWFGKRCSNQNIAMVYHRIQNLFPSPNLVLHFHLDRMQGSSIQTLLSHPSFMNWTTLLVVGDRIDIEDFNLIMSTASMERSIFINVQSMPESCAHEKVFQFRNIEFHGAHWFRIENLFALRNCDRVVLSLNQINFNHLNQLLRYWMKCDYCMFRQLTIYIEGLFQFLPNQVFKDVSYLSTSRRGYPEFLILSSSYKTLKFPVAVVPGIESAFKIATVSSIGDYAQEYEILKTLESLKYLKEELKNSARAPKQLEQEIRVHMRKLEQMNVQLVNGNIFM